MGYTAWTENHISYTLDTHKLHMKRDEGKGGGGEEGRRGRGEEGVGGDIRPAWIRRASPHNLWVLPVIGGGKFKVQIHFMLQTMLFMLP